MRAVLFCNEHFGLGHLRRCLAIAAALVELDPRATALVVTGSRANGSVPLPPGVRTLKLPPSPTDSHTHWRSGDGPAADVAGTAAADVRALRSQRSLAAVRELRPDVALVDYLPTGRADELLPTLEWLRRAGCPTVLGLREVDDEAATIGAEWDGARVETVRRLYDLVLVYGPELPGDVRVRRLRAASVDVRHLELVAARVPTDPPPDLPPASLLATAGGGIDGHGMLAAILDALRERPLPLPTVMVAGPMMPASDLARLRAAARGLDVRLERSRSDMQAAMGGARAVVAMAGYNTVAELLQTGSPALLIPRTEPRAEQLVRARRLSAQGRVSVMLPDHLAPAALRAALDDLLAASRHAPARLGGAGQAAAALHALGRSPTSAAADAIL